MSNLFSIYTSKIKELNNKIEAAKSVNNSYLLTDLDIKIIQMKSLEDVSPNLDFKLKY